MNSKSISTLSSFFVPGAAAAADEQVRQESLAVSAGLKRQDAGLLDELIVRYQHRLMRYLLYLTGNREQAEDLFQEVWMRVLVRGAQFNGQARFETWLFTIARNLVIDQRRKRTMGSLDELFEGGSEDDRPMALRLPTASRRRLTILPTWKTGSGLRRRCWNWIRCTARCWCSGSTKSCRWKRLPR